jgi:hypothetical protein
MVKYRDNNIDNVVDFYLEGNTKSVGDRGLIRGDELNAYRVKDCSSRQMKILEIERLTPYQVDSKDSTMYRVRVQRTDPTIKKLCVNTMVEEILTGNRVGVTCSDVFDLPEGENEFEFKVTLNHLNLRPGDYMVDFWVSAEPMVNSWNLYDAVYDALTFQVETYNKKMFGLWDSSFGYNYFDGCETEMLK